jgi:hypothetical protein
MRNAQKIAGLVFALSIFIEGAFPVFAEDIYLAPEEFLAETFGDEKPAPSFLWVKGDMRKQVDRILQHGAFRGLRVRYWKHEDRTAWILEEIGKYKPITTGIVVNGDAIERIQVLIYRESHGWEVRHDFFTDQFVGLRLNENQKLDAKIDGISGATLSVNALTNLARLALYFDDSIDP